MLVISRKLWERVQIGPNVFVTVTRIGPETVRLGIEAPEDVHIVRCELIELDADGKPKPHVTKGID